jgi:hypothetical protein
VIGNNTLFETVDVVFNPLKTEFLRNNIYKFSLYLTGNTLPLHFKAQPVNAVWGKKSLFVVRTIRGTQIHSVGRMQSFSVLKRVVHILTTRL